MTGTDALRSARRIGSSVKRPFHAMTCLAAATHHAFELAAGVGLVFQPYLGLRGAAGLWGTTLPAWLLLSARGSRRWDRILAFLAGLSLGGAAVHFTLWPVRRWRGLPVLEEAEGLRPEHLPAYNAVLYGWALAALAAIVADPRPGARRWAIAGALCALPLRASARYHFRWVREQARSNPAWWNRALVHR